MASLSRDRKSDYNKHIHLSVNIKNIKKVTNDILHIASATFFNLVLYLDDVVDIGV